MEVGNTFEHSNKKFAGQFLKALHALFPNATIEQLWQDALNLSQNKNAEKYKKTLSDLDYNSQEIKEIQKNIQMMRNAGFDIKHIMLYISSPTESPLGHQTTKDDYLKMWHRENDFKPVISKSEVIERSAFAAKSLIALVGITTILPGALVGLYLGNEDVVEVGKIAAEGFIGVIEDFGDVFSDPSFKNIVKSSLVALGFGVAGMTLTRQNKKAESIDLRAKIRDGGRTEDDKKILLEKMNKLSSATKHLISHFSPEETCLFLETDDETQEKMWRANPPSFEQRCLSNLVDGKAPFFEKMWQQAKLSAAAWDRGSILVGPVNLKESLIALRQKKEDILKPKDLSI